ncbi:MAG: hypothetical protein ACRDQI_13470, partial [Pseudonocardiaceae bacterium]
MRRQLERTLWATAFLAVLLAPVLLAPVLLAPVLHEPSAQPTGVLPSAQPIGVLPSAQTAGVLPSAEPDVNGASMLSGLSVGMGLLATSMLVCAVVLP